MFWKIKKGVEGTKPFQVSNERVFWGQVKKGQVFWKIRRRDGKGVRGKGPEADSLNMKLSVNPQS